MLKDDTKMKSVLGRVNWLLSGIDKTCQFDANIIGDLRSHGRRDIIGQLKPFQKVYEGRAMVNDIQVRLGDGYADSKMSN